MRLNETEVIKFDVVSKNMLKLEEQEVGLQSRRKEMKKTTLTFIVPYFYGLCFL